MADIFRNNPIVVRQAILYEFLKGEPIDKACKEFCKSLGDDFMIYPEFELWWMRFSNGKFKLKHDRTLDPKCRTLNELPEHVFKEIARYLSPHEKYILRNVSKNIRRIVDSWKPNVVNMDFDEEMPVNERLNYSYFLRNPKLELDRLEVYERDNRSAKMIEHVLKEVKHQVRVKELVMEPIISNTQRCRDCDQ